MTVAGTREERIAAVAAGQRGRLSRAQLLHAGVSSSAIGRMLARGHLLPRHRGVYLVGHAAPVPLGDETDALLAAGPGSVLGSFSAGRQWDMVAPGAGDGTVHILVSSGRGPSLPGVTVHRTSILIDRDIRWRDRLPVASPARALLDLATTLTTRRLELAIDRGLVASVLRPDDLDELLARSRGHHGHHPLAAAAADLDAEQRHATLTDSEAEELLLDLVRRADLPGPLVGARRHGYQIDFLWPDHGLAVEIDGERFHRTSRAFHHDRRKDRELFAHGIVVLRYPPRELARRPLAVISELSAGLSRAGTAAP